MSRDTSSMYSGMTSASFAKQRVRREQQKRDLSEKRQRLLPINDELEAIYKAEKEALLTDLARIIDEDMTPEDVKVLVAATKLTNARLVSIKQRLDSILRQPKITAEAEDEA